MNTLEATQTLGLNTDLTDAQKRALDEQWFFVVENVFSPQEVVEMKAKLRALYKLSSERFPRPP